MEITVRRGDSFWSFSQLFQVPLRLLLDSNRGVNPQSLTAGQTVRIPGFTVSSYRIAAGDSVWSIASGLGVPPDTLLLLNPSLQPGNLPVGSQIRTPSRVTGRVTQTGRPYGSAELERDLGRLTDVYPFLLREAAGASVMGRPLEEIRVGSGAKRVHVNGSFHANEWITSNVLVRFLDEYSLALTNGGSIRGLAVNPLYEATQLSLVPMVNPDGVDLVVNGLPGEDPYRSEALAINGGSTDFSGWKANIRGVDLNDQFPALWEREAERGAPAPAPRDYAGTAPLTEPEAQAMARLTGERDFRRVLAFHTQGSVIFWGFNGLEPPESEALVQEFARVSGYEPIAYTDSYAGYKDWFIQDWRRPGFTVELGRGVNPLPLSQLEQIYQESLGILLVSLNE